MEELLKKLLESELLDAETAEAIKRKISEVESAAEARATKRLEGTYRDDKQKLVAAMDLMIAEGLRTAVEEFARERKSLGRLAAKAAKEAATANRRADEALARKAAALQIMLEENIKKEIAEFRQDRKAERAAVVKVVREARHKADRDREAFIKRGAVVLETVIEDMLGKKVKELAEDIKAARRNDFGRRIFESVAAEFRSTFYNENAEARKLARALAATRKRLAVVESTAKVAVEAAKKEATKAASESKRLREQAERSKLKSELLGKLSGDARNQMRVILESQPLGSMRDTYKKFLPEVLSGTKGRRLLESRAGVKPTGTLELKEGNRDRAATGFSDTDGDLAALRLRAGIRG